MALPPYIGTPGAIGSGPYIGTDTSPRQLPEYYPPPPMGEGEKGLRRGIGTMAGTLEASLAQLSEPFSKAAADKLFADAQQTLNFGPELAPAVPSIRDIHDASTFGKWATGMGGEFIPQGIAMAAGGLGGGLLGAGLRAAPRVGAALGAGATFVPPAMGSTALALHNDPRALLNTTPTERLALSGGVGLGSAALMAAAPLASANRALTGAAIERGFIPAVGNIGLEAARTGVGLGAASGASTALEQKALNYANPQRDTSGDAAAIEESVLSGAGAGALFGAAGGLTHAVRSAVTPRLSPEAGFTPRMRQMQAGYKTAETLDRAATYLKDKMVGLTRSVSQKTRASVGWTDADRLAVERLQDTPYFKQMNEAGLDDSQKLTVASWLRQYDVSPKLITPEIHEALRTVLGAEPQEVRDYLMAQQKALGAVTPEPKAESAGLQPEADLGKIEAPKISKEDEAASGVMDVRDEGGEPAFDTGIQEGKLTDIQPVLDRPIEHTALQNSLQNMYWYNKQKLDTENPQPHVMIKLSSDTMSPEQIARSFQFKDRDQNGRPILRGLTADEIKAHTTEDGVEVPLQLFALANEVTRRTMSEARKAATSEEADTIRSSLPPLREGQRGDQDSRKGDLAFNALTTLMNNGVDINGHHVNVDISPREIKQVMDRGGRGMKEILNPRIILGEIPKKGEKRAPYTVGDYSNEAPAWTPKTLEQLATERKIVQRYEGIHGPEHKGSKQWYFAIKKELADVGVARVNALKEYRANKTADNAAKFEELNRQYRTLNSLWWQRKFMMADRLEQFLRKKYGEGYDAALANAKPKYPDRGPTIWDLATKQEADDVSNAVITELHDKVKARNLRGTVNREMDAAYEALQYKAADRLTANPADTKLIENFQRYLEGEEPTSDVVKFLREHNIRQFSPEILQDPALRSEKTGKMPQEDLIDRLDWQRNRALGNEFAGIHDQSTINDLTNTEAFQNEVWGLGNNQNPPTRKELTVPRYTGMFNDRRMSSTGELMTRPVTPEARDRALRRFQDLKKRIAEYGKWRITQDKGTVRTNKLGFFKTKEDAKAFIDALPEDGFAGLRIDVGGRLLTLEEAQAKWGTQKEPVKAGAFTTAEGEVRGGRLSKRQASIINPDTGEVLTIAGVTFHNMPPEMAVTQLETLIHRFPNKDSFKIRDGTPRFIKAQDQPVRGANESDEAFAHRLEEVASKASPLSYKRLEEALKVDEKTVYDAGTAATPGEGTTTVEKLPRSVPAGKMAQDTLFETKGVTNDFGERVLPAEAMKREVLDSKQEAAYARAEEKANAPKPQTEPQQLGLNLKEPPKPLPSAEKTTDNFGNVVRRDYRGKVVGGEGEPAKPKKVTAEERAKLEAQKDKEPVRVERAIDEEATDADLRALQKKVEGGDGLTEKLNTPVERKPGEVGSIDNPRELPMRYTAKAEDLRADLRAKYPEGVSMAQLIADGERVATTRTPPMGLRKGDYIYFPGVQGKFRVTGFVRITFDKAGRAAWEAREGWDAQAAHNKFPTQVKSGAVQIRFERAEMRVIEPEAPKPKPKAGINFEQSKAIGYPVRTRRNAAADATIAIAADFTTGGERLTRNAVEQQGKTYVPIRYTGEKATDAAVASIIEKLNSIGKPKVELNIAGNGIYTLKKLGDQAKVDEYAYDLLKRVANDPRLKTEIVAVRSGGQTGFDEAGAKAAQRLGIETIIHAPKDWRFRNVEGRDISDEAAFKARFNTPLFEQVEKAVNKVEAAPKKKEITEEEAVGEIGESIKTGEINTVTLRDILSRVKGMKPEEAAQVKEFLQVYDDVVAGKYSKPSLAQTTVDAWSAKYANGEKVLVATLPKDKLYAFSATEDMGGAQVKINGKQFIIRPDTALAKNKVTSLSRLAHEFGHALQKMAFDNAPESVKKEIMAAYERDVAALVASGKGEDLTRFRGFNMYLDMTSSLATKLGKLYETLPPERRGEAVKLAYAKEFNPARIFIDSPEHFRYLTSFPEWFAENFSKYVTSGDRITMPPEIRTMWGKLYATLKQFFRNVVQQFKPDQTFAQWVDSLAKKPVEPGLGSPRVEKPTKPAFEKVETAKGPPEYSKAMEGGSGGEPPKGGPPKGGPPEPPKPPDPMPEMAKKMKDIITRLFGKQVELRFEEHEGAKPGENAWYVGRKQLDQYTANVAKMREVREERRKALNPSDGGAPDLALAERLKEKEERLRQQTEVVGIIKLSPRLAEREAMGALYHESTHAAFDVLLSQEERATLATAFTKGTVARRLRELFKDDPQALEHMKDPEEAAAYGFQVYAISPEKLQLGAKVKGIFDRVAQFFRQLLGITTPEEKAKIIMDDMLSGRRVDRGLTPVQRLLEKDMTTAQKVQKLARTFGGVVKAGWDVVATSSYERMLAMNNPAAAEIAKRGYTKTGEQGHGYIQAWRASANRFTHILNKMTKGLDPKDFNAGVEARIMGTVPPEGTGARAAYDALTKFFAEMHLYSTEAQTGIGFEKNYWPMGWDAEKVLNNREAFMAMINKPEYEQQMLKLKITPNELWENISNYVTYGDSFQDVIAKGTQEPVNQYAKERSLSFIKPEDRRPFMSDDHLHTLMRYTQQMVRQAEYVRAYGPGGEKLRALYKDAEQKYGATKAQVALMKDYVDGLLGDKGIGMSRAQKDLYGALVVYQNFRLLPYNLFSSLVDPLGIAVRSNSMMDAGTTFLYNMKNLFRDLKKDRSWESKDKWEKYAEDLGVIEDAGLMSNIGAMYEPLDIRGTTQKLQEALFKYNLLNGWERNTKVMATKAAERFLRRAKDDFFGEHNERYLKELNLSKSDLVLKSDGELALRKEELMEQGVSEEQARQIEERLQNAVVKFVNQSVLNPTAGDLPNWGSNPYFAPVFHLKQYMFTFQSTILRRMYDEAKMGNWKPMLASTVYVPGMIAADMMRGFVQNYGSQPTWQQNWTTADYLYNGVDRAGLTGTGGLLTGIRDDIMHGGSGAESLMGPALEQAKQTIMAPTSPRTWAKSMPLYPVFGHFTMGGAGPGMATPRGE